MNELMLLAASLPMGDDTPILLYTLIGLGALALLIVTTIMGKKNKNGKK